MIAPIKQVAVLVAAIGALAALPGIASAGNRTVQSIAVRLKR